jgi:hypothetical protein
VRVREGLGGSYRAGGTHFNFLFLNFPHFCRCIKEVEGPNQTYQQRGGCFRVTSVLSGQADQPIKISTLEEFTGELYNERYYRKKSRKKITL